MKYTDGTIWYSPTSRPENPVLMNTSPVDDSLWTISRLSGIQELQTVARSLNVLDSQVIYSTDTTTVLDDVLYIYDATEQVTWSLPSDVGTGEVIVSVSSGGVLTTDAASYTLAAPTSINVTTSILTSDMKTSGVIRTSGYDNVFDNGGTTWVETGYTVSGSAGTFDRVNGKIYDINGKEFYYLAGTTVKLDDFGLCAGNIDDGKTVLDDVMSFASCILMNGTYTVSNVEFPNKALTFRNIGKEWAIFKSLDGEGDSSYFAAPIAWIDSSSGASSPVRTYGVGFDGGTKDITLVVHWYFGDHQNLYIKDGVSYGVKMTAINNDGTYISSTMVNNRFRNIWIQGTSDIGFAVTEDGQTTDWHLNDGFIFNSGSINIQARTIAGASIIGTHCYGASTSLSFKKWSTGTRVSNNYFEGAVLVNEGLNSTSTMHFGPSNTVNGDITLNFGVESGSVVSKGNYLSTVTHNYFGDKTFCSFGDSFSSSSPFSFFNTSSSNSAKILVDKSLIDGTPMSGALSPELGKTTASKLYEPFTTGSAPYMSKYGLTNVNTVSQAVTVPTLGSDSSYILTWDVGARLNHTGTTEIAASYRYNILRKQLTTTYAVTTLNSVITTGSFTSSPAITVVDNGDSTSTITLSATWADIGYTIGSSQLTVF